MAGRVEYEDQTASGKPVPAHLDEFTQGWKNFKELTEMVDDAMDNKKLSKTLMKMGNEAQKKKYEKGMVNSRDFPTEHFFQVFENNNHEVKVKRIQETSQARDTAIKQAQAIKQQLQEESRAKWEKHVMRKEIK